MSFRHKTFFSSISYRAQIYGIFPTTTIDLLYPIECMQNYQVKLLRSKDTSDFIKNRLDADREEK